MRWRLTHNDRTLTLLEATQLEVDQLELFFTRQIPSARHDPRVKAGQWDGMIKHFKQSRYLAAGLWGELSDMCEKFDMSLDVEGIERLFDDTVDEASFRQWAAAKWADSAMKNREYQVAAAFKMLRTRSCLSELATSAGKSLIAFMVLAYLLDTGRARRILVIVPTVDLVTQTSSDFEGYNKGTANLELRVERIHAGSEEVSRPNLVVGTYQSLVKRSAEWLSQFDVVVVDEVHKAKSHSIKSILEKCLGSGRRLGLSGTVPKPDTLERLTIMSNTGPVVTQIKAAQLIEEGYISPCEVFVLELNYAPKEVRSAFRDLFKGGVDDRKALFNLEKNYAIESRARLQFVTDFVLKNPKNTLVLFHRIEYGKALYDQLRSKTDRPVYYIDGGTDSDFRGAYKDRMEDGLGKVLVASFGTFSTGINVTNLHAVYLTESFKSDVIIRQSIGRGLRKHATKDKLIVVDFVDDYRYSGFSNYLFKHSLERRKIYKEEKFAYSVRRIDLVEEQTQGLFT